MPKHSFSRWGGWLCLAGWLLATSAWGQPPFDPARLRRELGEKGFQEYMKKRKEAATPAKLTPDEEALLEASRKGDLAAVTALLDKRVKPTIRALNGETPLGRASAFGNNDIADLLLSKGAKIDDVDDMGTPLWWAANRGDAQRVAALLAQGADVNTQVGTSPAAIAAITGHADVVRLLLAKGAKPDVFSCALVGDAKTLAALLKDDPTLAKATASQGVRNALSPLHLATEAGHAEVVELLLANGADGWLKRSDMRTPAELIPSLPILKLYLAKEDFVKTIAGSRLIARYMKSDRSEMAAYMIERGGLPPNAPQLLVDLDLEKDRDLIQLLIASGALKSIDLAGRTALDLAIYSASQPTKPTLFGVELGEITVKRNPQRAFWLIAQGAPIDQIYGGNQTTTCALNEAARHNEMEVLKTLLDKGVNLTPQWRTVEFPGGRTMKEPTYAQPPLAVAAAHSNLDVIKLLVERGVNVNDADPQTGWTPLHAAASSNRREVVDYLLSQGANPKARTKDRFQDPGETPSQAAAHNKHAELAAVLKSKE